MFFGASVWPMEWQPPYEEAIKRAARLGFQGVELIAWSADVLRDYYTPERIRELRSLLNGEGLTLTNFFRIAKDLSSVDSARRAAAVDDFARGIDVAAALRSPTIATVAPYPFALDVPHLLARPTTQEWVVDVPRDLDWTQNYNDFVAALTECCALAEKAGLRVVIEPHPYRWVNSAQSMLRLIERTEARNLGMNLDPSHLFPSGEIPHYTVYQLGSRIYHTHVSDNDGQSNAHWRPGKGKVDWRGVLRALHDVGYRGVISLELEDVPGAAKRGKDSTSELDGELKLAMAYLKGICDQEGIPTRR